jgi:hypothetical protein
VTFLDMGGRYPDNPFAAVIFPEDTSKFSDVGSLRGRWRGNAHPGEVGAAVRKLGFERRRNWRGADGFRALWCKVT